MGIKWKNRVKKWMTEALLGTLLIVPMSVLSCRNPLIGIYQREASQEQESSHDGKLPGGRLAGGELPGEGAGIMLCGDWEEEKEALENQ